MTYNPGVPSGNIPLNQDYLNLKNNFTSINNQFLVDHVPLTSTSGTPPNGYHTSVHLVPQAAPVATVGYGQIFDQTFNDGINTDQTLYFLTGGNRKLQLTRNFVPVTGASGSSGYTFLPGGLILQWGLATISGPGTGVQSFNVKTANIYNIQTNLIGNSTSVNIVTVVSATSGSPGSFIWNYTGTSSSPTYTSFYWMAVTN